MKDLLACRWPTTELLGDDVEFRIAEEMVYRRSAE
jgi:hypothetical protein